jgi:hypothetical protein
MNVHYRLFDVAKNVKFGLRIVTGWFFESAKGELPELKPRMDTN